MYEVTLMLFFMTVALFVIAIVYENKNSLHWMTFFVSICSIAADVVDTSLDNITLTILVAVTAFPMLVSGWNAWGFAPRGKN